MSTNELRQAAGQATELKPITRTSNLLDRLKGQMSLALPKHLNADRMARLVLTQFSTNPALFDCTDNSIAGAVMTASQLGLEIGVGGQGYLIPYGKTATFVPGWQGLVDICNRAGRASAWTGAVFEGDDFEWALGDSPTLKHKPCGESDPTKLTHAYAIGRPLGSEWPIIECWNAKRLETHRAKQNKVGKKHYSFNHWEMYCRKVVLLQVLKYLPKSIELTAAVELSHTTEESPAIIDGDFMVIDQNEVEGSAQPTEEGSKDADPVDPEVEKTNARIKEIKHVAACYEKDIAKAKTMDEISDIAAGLGGDDRLTDLVRGELMAGLEAREAEIKAEK